MPKTPTTAPQSAEPQEAAVSVTKVTNLTAQKLTIALSSGKSLDLQPYQDRVLPGGEDPKNGVYKQLADKGLVSFSTSTK